MTEFLSACRFETPQADDAEGELQKCDAIVIGCGTIGLATGAALASKGWKIGLYDSDPARRSALAGRSAVFAEADLARAFLAARSSGHLQIFGRLTRQEPGQVYIVCVPTPVSAAGALDCTALDAAMAAIAGAAQPFDTVLIRSTVPPGTTRRLAAQMKARGLDLRFAATPDRSIEGQSFAGQMSIRSLSAAPAPRPPPARRLCTRPWGRPSILAARRRRGGQALRQCLAGGQLCRFEFHGHGLRITWARCPCHFCSRGHELSPLRAAPPGPSRRVLSAKGSQIAGGKHSGIGARLPGWHNPVRGTGPGRDRGLPRRTSIRQPRSQADRTRWNLL